VTCRHPSEFPDLARVALAYTRQLARAYATLKAEHDRFVRPKDGTLAAIWRRLSEVCRSAMSRAPQRRILANTKVMPESDEGLAERRSRRASWPVLKIRLNDDHEAFDAEAWKSIDPSRRAECVFELSVLQARTKGFDGDQLRVQRTIARVDRLPRFKSTSRAAAEEEDYRQGAEEKKRGRGEL